jgi:eukaryotic-like serine/threonine-protein kinase
MHLAPGDHAGPYVVGAPLGAGGMGEVYRARDTRLGRDVALKVLFHELARDPSKVARFEQEARAASALNHPNIVTVHDVGWEGPTSYIVSELVEGESLRRIIARGPVPPRKAIQIGIQIAEGLAAAHSAGIIHRDLKPENIMVTHEGRVKILDFGLARQTVLPSGGLDQATISVVTNPGVMMGTVGYMSPEQVKGMPVDQRSDIFSAGIVLYEMLAGRNPFDEPTAVEVLNAILKEDPPELGPQVPRGLERIVRYCLEKRPEDRFQSAHDLAYALKSAPTTTSNDLQQEVPVPASRPWRWAGRGTVFAVGLTLGLLATTAVMHWLAPISAGPPTVRYLTYSGSDYSPAPAPDGKTMAFTSARDGRQRIWLKHLTTAEEIALTTGPDDFPRYSPDGSMVLFARTEGERSALYRVVSMGGGEPRKVVENAAYGDWSPDGKQIVFVRSKAEGLRTLSVIGLVEASGNNPREVAVLRDVSLSHPRWSPDGSLLAAVELQSGLVQQRIVLLDADGKNERTLPAPPGGFSLSSLAWLSDGRRIVYAQAESPTAAVVGGGSAARIVRQDVTSGKWETLLSMPQSVLCLDVAGKDALVFDTRSSRVTLREVSLKPGSTASTLWLTRGNSNDRQPSYSPDGKSVLFSSNRSGNLDIWRVSAISGAVRRITDDLGADWDPAFLPDGRNIVWTSNRSGNMEIWTAAVDGSGVRQLSRDGVGAENPVPTPDGQWVLYIASNTSPRMGLWKVRTNGKDAQQLLSGDIGFAEVSPDGEHVLYLTNWQSDRPLLRVIRLRDGSPVDFQIEVQVRKQGIGNPGRCRWLPDGRAIAFLGQDDRGLNGVFIQDFRPGVDTSSTRRAVAGFEGDAATESFGISPDGEHITLAAWDQVFSIALAQRVPGILPRLPLR